MESSRRDYLSIQYVTVLQHTAHILCLIKLFVTVKKNFNEINIICKVHKITYDPNAAINKSKNKCSALRKQCLHHLLIKRV